MRLFGMVSTEASRLYTPKAVESFFSYTELAEGEKLLLIDNDGSLENSKLSGDKRIEFVKNKTPLSFSENLNASIKRASGGDVYFLNNDLIFTPNWLDPLLPITDAIATPVSNREFQYIKDGLRCERYLSLEDYLGKERELLTVVDYHRSQRNGLQPVLCLPFFCVKLPAKVYEKLGPLDETFGKGGAEDNDYCLRAYLEGFQVLYALNSYILHFSGKSTWHGAETAEETKQRDNAYLKRFDEKWGLKLRRLAINGDLSVLAEDPNILSALQRGKFREVIIALQKDNSG